MSPDGAQVAFSSNRTGQWGIYVKDIFGTDDPGDPILVDGGPKGVTDWSQDDDLIIQMRVRPGLSIPDNDIFRLPLAAQDRDLEFLVTGGNYGRLNADETLIAFVSIGAQGNSQIFVQAYPDAGDTRRQVTFEGGTQPIWGADPTELYYGSSDSIMAQKILVTEEGIDPGPTSVAVPGIVSLGVGFPRYGVTSDGSFIVLELTGESTNTIGATAIANFQALLQQ